MRSRSLRYLAALFISATATCSHGAVSCAGVPDSLELGKYGGMEHIAFVVINGLTYRIGDYVGIEASRVKPRMELAAAAITANKQLVLQFWNYTDCFSAATQQGAPNAVLLVR